MLQEYTWASVYNISVRSTSKHSDCGLWLLKVSLHMHKYETHIENAPQKKLTWEPPPPKKTTKKHGNGLNGSHTDLSQTLSQREPRKNKKKCFQVSPFHTPHILSAVTDLFRVEKRQEIQKGPKIRVWRAFRGKVQVCHFSCASQYKNATRTLLLSTTQVRGRPNPLQFAKFFKKGLGNWQASLLVNAVSTALNFLLQLFAFSVYQLVGRRKSNCGSLPSCASSLLCLKSHLLYVLRIATPHSHSYDFCLD